ncbi:MAG: glycerophosphodiester phosphodiesterase family protein [bacterium]
MKTKKHFKTIRFPAATLLLLACFAVSAQAADIFTPREGRRVLVVAHRGANKFAPANTIPATEKAIEMKLDFVEIDVRTTKDGRLVIMHNSTVDGTTDGKGAVRDLTLEEIKKLDAGVRVSPNFKGVRVPTIEEYFAAAQGKINTYLDWKDAEPATLAAAIEKAGAVDSTIVYGGPLLLLELKKINPNIRVMPDAENAKQLTAMRDAGLSFETVGASMMTFNAKLSEKAHEMGAKVFVDILGQAESCAGVKKAIRYGADAVQSDQPDMVLRCLDSMDKEAPVGTK